MAESSTTRAAASGGGGGAVYFFGFIGALVFYWQQADGFWPHVLAMLQAIVWPAYVVYDLLGHIT